MAKSPKSLSCIRLSDTLLALMSEMPRGLVLDRPARPGRARAGHREGAAGAVEDDAICAALARMTRVSVNGTAGAVKIDRRAIGRADAGLVDAHPRDRAAREARRAVEAMLRPRTVLPPPTVTVPFNCGRVPPSEGLGIERTVAGHRHAEHGVEGAG